MEEIYKDIKGYEGKYQISNLGNVKSLPKGDGNGNKERILKQEVVKRDHTNYRRVTLSKNGETERFQVHRLVAEAFIDNPENKPFVNHIDNNGETNTVSNLEWCTHSENMMHSQKQGRQEKVIIAGTKASVEAQAKLTAERHSKLIGKQFNNLVIKSIWPVQDVMYTYMATATCILCNHDCDKLLTDIVRGRKSAYQCNDCTQKLTSEKKRIEKIESLKNSVINGKYITDAWYNYERQLYIVTIKCTVCSTTKTLTLNHLMDKRYISTCCNN